MASHQRAVIVTQMHAIAAAFVEHAAVGTLSGPHPRMVAVAVEPAAPHLPEGILVDITLRIAAAYAEASRYIAVGKHRGGVESGLTPEKMSAHPSLVLTEKPLSGIRKDDLKLIAGTYN